MSEAIEAVLPLTPVQEGMLFHTTLGGENGAGGDYLAQIVFRLTGPVDLKRFEDAWRKVIARHPALRACFVTGTGEPAQVIRREVPFRLRTLDWTDQPESPQRLADWLAADRERGFVLARAPLLRVVLVRLPEQQHCLVWSFHHLLLDGWSVSLLLDEVLAGYGGTDSGPVELSFVDYLRWQDGRDRAPSRSYWQAELAGLEPAASLADLAAEPAPPVELNAEPAPPVELNAELTAELTAALAERARQTRSTVNSWLLAGWTQVLACYTGTTDVVTGLVTAGRSAPLPGIEQTIGLLVQTVPVRIRPTPQLSVSELVGQVMAAQLSADEHGHLGLVEIGRCSGLPPGSTLVQTLYAFENYPVRSGGATGGGRLHLSDPTFHEQTNYPLALVAAQPDRRVTLKLSYRPHQVSADRAAGMLHLLLRLMEQMVADPTRRLGWLPLHPPAAATGQHGAANAVPPGLTLAAAFAEQVAATPDAIAVDDESDQLSYGGLERLAQRLAGRLRAEGVGLGDRVGLALPRCSQLVQAHVAVQLAGATGVLVDPTGPADRVITILHDAAVKTIIAHGPVPALAGWTGRVLQVDADGTAAPAPGTPAATAAAYVIYTSGSTGRPKGVLVPQHGVLRMSRHPDYLPLLSQDVVAMAASPVFDAIIWEIWGPLLAGARIQVVAQETLLSSELLARLLRQARVSVLFVTTALFNVLSRTIPGELGQLRALLFGGEANDPNVIAELVRTGPPERLLHMYGPAECSTFAYWHEVRADSGLVPIGRPIAETSADLLDPAGRPVPPGAPGEIWLAGPGLAWGYLGRPGQSADVFRPHPDRPGQRRYRTGDLASLDDDGNARYLGRIDLQLKIRGNRVELGEIEMVLAGYPGVSQCVVQPARAEGGAVSHLIAYLVSRPGSAPVSEPELRSHLLTQLPDYMVPSRFVTLPALPLTVNGKVDRRALPAPLQAELFEPAADELEQRLAAIWAELLNIQTPGRDQDFYTLGGNSLLTMGLAGRIRRDLGRTLPLSTIAAHPTVAGLAALLRAPAGSRQSGPLVRLQAGRPGAAPLFCVHPGGGGVTSYAPLARHLGSEQPVYGLADLTRDVWPDRDVADLADVYLAAVRDVWPTGPYLFSGWSFGGLVAYQMAARLRAAGSEVPLVALLDTGAPEVVAGYADTDPALVLAVLATELLERDQEQIPELHQRLVSLPAAEQLEQVMRLLHQADKAPASAGADWMQRELDVFYGRVRAAARFQPPAPGGPVHLLRAASEPLRRLHNLPSTVVNGLSEPSLGWSAHVIDQLKIVAVSGDHGTLCLEPHVRSLGATLRQLISGVLASHRPMPPEPSRRKP